MWRWNVCYYMPYNNENEYCLAPDLQRLLAARPDTADTVFHFLITTSQGSWHYRLTGMLNATAWNYPFSYQKQPLSMADPQVLLSFLLNARQQDPATYHALMFSGNGCGTYLHIGNPSTLPTNWSTLTLAQQQIIANRTFLGIGRLRTVLEQVPCDLLAFDCCIMATLETAYELRKVVRYILASQEWLGVAGLNSPRLIYHFAQPASTPLGVATVLAREYIDRTNDPTMLTLTDSVTTWRNASVLATANLEALVQVLQAFPGSALRPQSLTQDPAWIDSVPEDECQEIDLYGVALRYARNYPAWWQNFRQVVVYNVNNQALLQDARVRHGLSYKVNPHVDSWAGAALYAELALPLRLQGVLLQPYQNYRKPTHFHQSK
jgi:hypothetical protein